MVTQTTMHDTRSPNADGQGDPNGARKPSAGEGLSPRQSSALNALLLRMSVTDTAGATRSKPAANSSAIPATTSLRDYEHFEKC